MSMRATCQQLPSPYYTLHNLVQCVLLQRTETLPQPPAMCGLSPYQPRFPRMNFGLNSRPSIRLPVRVLALANGGSFGEIPTHQHTNEYQRKWQVRYPIILCSFWWDFTAMVLRECPMIPCKNAWQYPIFMKTFHDLLSNRGSIVELTV